MVRMANHISVSYVCLANLHSPDKVERKHVVTLGDPQTPLAGLQTLLFGP